MGERLGHISMAAFVAGLAACVSFVEPTSYACELASAAEDCPEGWSCEGGKCVDGAGGGGDDGCRTIVDCARQDAFCGSDGECYGVNCGTPANGCDRCALGPDNGHRHPLGPLIFDARQTDLALGSASLCVPDMDGACEAGNEVCAFSFQAYDEQFDQPLDEDGLTSYLYHLGDDGEELGVVAPFFDGERYHVRVCVDAAVQDISLAFFLDDLDFNHSNSLCAYGAKSE